MNPVPSRKLRLLIVLLICLVSGTSTQYLNAAEDSQSLDLLVKTIASVEDVDVLKALLRGMLKGLEGRRDIVAPPGWAALSGRLNVSSDSDVRKLTDHLSQVFGDEVATQRALAVVQDENASPPERIRQLAALLAQRNQEASNLLESLLDTPELQLAAVRGYSEVENQSAPSVLLRRYPKMTDHIKRAVIETLSTRRSYAEALLAAIQNESIKRGEIPTHVARSLKTLLGQRFVAVFGEPPALGADREKQMAKWKARLTSDALNEANASAGRVVFQKTCAACHLLYGEGGTIGPDLTGSNRANLDYLLLNSVDPSYDVPAAYRMVTIVTNDGRVVNGVVAEEDNKRIVLKTVEKPRMVIAKSDIEERVVSKKSMMPDGQFEALKPQQVIDLVKYLKTTEQVELAQ